MKTTDRVDFKNLLNQTIDFAHYKNVGIKKLLGRGTTFASYECVFSKNGRQVKGIIKEFLPQSFYKPSNEQQNTEEISVTFDYPLTCDSRGKHIDYMHVQNDVGNVIVRYLPAQKDVFITAYDEFISNQKKVQSLLDEAVDQNYKLRRYITQPLDVFTISPKASANKNTFAYFELYLYEEKDFNKCALTLPIQKNLCALIRLCNVLDKLHRGGVSVNDLKPANFLYDEDAGMPILQVFDLGSVRKIAADGKLVDGTSLPSSTTFYGAPEYVSGKYISGGGGIYADIYSIGAILMFILFMYEERFVDGVNRHISRESEVKDTLELLDQCIETTYNDHKYTKGFLDYAKHIISHCITGGTVAEVQTRYHNTSHQTAAQHLADDLKTLLEIYDNQGVHPEVMLNRAISQADQLPLDDLDEDLFTEIQAANGNDAN